MGYERRVQSFVEYYRGSIGTFYYNRVLVNESMIMYLKAQYLW